MIQKKPYWEKSPRTSQHLKPSMRKKSASNSILVESSPGKTSIWDPIRNSSVAAAARSPSRINQILSLAGVTSRRKADELIQTGRVMVNNQVIRERGTRAVWGSDSIRVNGEEIPRPSPRTYLVLNKPFGYVCSLNDPEGRPTILDLIKDIPRRVYPVGRLDFDSLGILFLTDDGEWAHRLAHPRYRVPKTYKVTVKGNTNESVLAQLRKGVQLEDGFSGPAKAAFIKNDKGKSVLRITVTSGRKRLIRRMLEAVGYEVVHLMRTGYGTIELGKLKIGEYRILENHEIQALKKMVGLP